MENLKKYAIGILAGMIVFAGLYLWHNSQVKKADETGYWRGLTECEKDTDTTFIKGDTVFVRDTTIIYKSEPVIEIENNVLASVTDSTFVSNKDTISVESKVIFDLKEKKADWTLKIDHKDFLPLPDTVKIYTPKYIEKVVVENNWMYNLIAYGAGVLTAIIIWVVTLL